MTFDERRRLARSIRATHDEFMEILGLAPLRGPRLRLLRGFRLRADLFARLPPPIAPTEQGVELECPLRFDRVQIADIEGARFAIVDPGEADRANVLTALVSLLVSGRPVVLRRTSGSRLRWEELEDFSISESVLRTMSETQLSTVALGQLRSLVLCRTDRRPGSGTERALVSVVMSTNRPDHVIAAVRRIQAQRHVGVQLIVGCHGFDASEVGEIDVIAGAVEEFSIASFHADEIFGDVLKSLSESARHEWLAKWDDDDLYGPHHLFDLWAFALLSRSTLVGKAAEFVLLEERKLLVRRRGGRPYTVSRFLAGGALLMSTPVLRGIGSWASIPRSVDQDIIRRFEAAGHAPFRIHGHEFVLVRHASGHTWAATSDYFERAADEILDAGSLDTAFATTQHAELRAWPVHGPIDLDICVPNKDNPGAVDRFERTRRSAPEGTRLVVCDDRSDPPLGFTEAGPELSMVRFESGEGFGAGRSRHRAASASAGDGLIFADADMLLEAETIQRVSETFAAGFRGAIHADIAFTELVGDEIGAMQDAVGSDVVGQLERLRLSGQTWRHRHWANSADYRHPQSSTFRASVGAFVAIDRQTYLDTGGFRDIPVRGVEDTEFGYRLMVAGAEQRLDRSGGVWHLGERTFADRLGPDEEATREIYLAALVPIWNRNLAERREALEHWDGSVVPFAATSNEDVVDEVQRQFGPGALTAATATSVLDAPFALAVDLLPSQPVEAVNAALVAFRNRRCGEVMVVEDGQAVGRFVALWALNLAARRTGDPLVYTSLPDAASVERLIRRVRRDFGMSIVALD